MRQRDLHHSQGVEVAEVLAATDSNDDDPMIIWMALITERERLDLIVNSRYCEGKVLSDADVAQVATKLSRVTVLLDLVLKRAEEVRKVFR